MSDLEFDEMSRGQRQKSDATQTRLSFVEEAFLELFKLLEQYAPVWYTEEHHQAAAALRVLQEPPPFSKEATRSQKAGCREASNDCHGDLLHIDSVKLHFEPALQRFSRLP